METVHINASKEIEFAMKHKYQIVKCFIGDKFFLILHGDEIRKPESWKDKKDCFACHVLGGKKFKKKELIRRLGDLKDDYIFATGTDGNKIDWDNLIKYHEN